MIVAGVDSSLRSTGIAIVDVSVGVIETQNPKGIELPAGASDAAKLERVKQMHTRIMLAIEDVDLVVIEGLSHASKGNARDQLAGLHFAIRLSLDACGVPWRLLAPQSRAKYATGHGGADKHAVLAAIRAEHATTDVDNHDVADAIALAAWGARQIGEPIDRDMEWRLSAEWKGVGA